jgi:hypothetical protein
MQKIKSVILLFLFVSVACAQTASIRGFVYLKETGEPVIFTNVYLKGTTYGVATDENGYFSITKVPPGTYNLTITYLGYDSIQESITLKAGEILTKKLYLNKSVLQIGEVEISSKRTDKQTEVKVSEITITPKEIKQLPTVGGEPDLAQYLQILPGVIFTGDQGGQLYIRGGSPIQNKVLLDGMVIYNPFHSIGLFSVFDAEIIRNADVYTGGFGAEYGGRISSIMDITTRDGNKKRMAGNFSVSPFGVKGLLEGPLKKQSETRGSSTSFMLSAKHSYLDKSSKVIYSYVDSAGLPFKYTDLYGKISMNSPNGSKLNLFGFNFRDKVKYQALSDFSWNSYGVGSNFLLVPAASPVLVEGNFAYSSYQVDMKEELRQPDSSRISGFNLGLNFTYFQGKNEIKYGLEVLGFKTTFQFYNSVNRKIEQVENTTEIAGYFKYKIIAAHQKLLIEPSIRLHYYASLQNFSPEPRLGVKYNVNERLRFKFAGGFYSQNLISASSDRDVVNLFYGFLSGTDNLQQSFTEEDGTVRPVKHKLQKANHLIGGVEYDLFKNIEVNIEAYRKNFTQLTNINRNKLYDDNSDASIPDVQKKDFIIETGKAQGIDFLIKYDYKKLYVWVVYSLGFVDRWDGTQSYNPHFDRRHNTNLVVAYNFGKKQDWEIDVRWNFGSGFPFTQTAGFYPNNTFSGGINTNYTTTNGNLGILYGELNQGRLPVYHRLDINVKKKFTLSENSKMEVSAGATNVYNRENIFYFDRVQYKRVNQLPIMPSLSMNWSF